MASLSKYFIQDESNLLVRNDCIVFGNNYRFSVLTERLIRLEYSPSGKFEDRASELVINRNFPKPNFTYQKKKGMNYEAQKNDTHYCNCHDGSIYNLFRFRLRFDETDKI